MYGHSLRYRRGAFTALLVIVTLLLVSFAHADLTADEQKLLSGISIDRMMSTVERLCADDFQGRRAGSPEHYAVADYLAAQYEKAGLSAVDSGSFEGFKQPLTMRYALIKSKSDIKATISYPSGGVRKTRTFAYSNYNGAGGLKVNSEVVFVGHGIHDPEAGVDDYAGLDVSGKIVLWLSGQPQGVKLTQAPTGVRKMVTAYQRGAVACLIHRPAGIKDEWGTNTGLAGTIADFPYIAVDERISSELLGITIPPGSSVKSGTAGPRIDLEITPVCDPHRKTYNIIGVLPGCDPAVSEEIVMVGGHYDHLGATTGGEIYRGADDNASGTTVVLEIARIIQASGLAPRRTMVFAAWTGEEAGLIGSNYFAANPPFPLKRIVSNFEFDMVGQGTGDTFVTTGSAAYPSHHARLESSAVDLGLGTKPERYPGASDYLAFTRKGVPSSLIYADGDHPNYHTTRDTPAGINRRVLESAARLGALAAWRAANL